MKKYWKAGLWDTRANIRNRNTSLRPQSKISINHWWYPTTWMRKTVYWQEDNRTGAIWTANERMWNQVLVTGVFWRPTTMAYSSLLLTSTRNWKKSVNLSRLRFMSVKLLMNKTQKIHTIKNSGKLSFGINKSWWRKKTKRFRNTDKDSKK